VTFHLACFGAGTPFQDTYFGSQNFQPRKLATEAFVAALPQHLLKNANGPALAVLGHLDRAWGSSFLNPRALSTRLPFENMVKRILMGYPLGLALQEFNERCKSLSAHLLTLRQKELQHVHVTDQEWIHTWRARNDAQGYFLLGDPAARLRVEILD
jgi:hypothetical protein